MTFWKLIWCSIFCTVLSFAQNGSQKKVNLPVLPSILHIITEPAGAKVFINNIDVGLTPFQGEIKTGAFSLSVKKDFYAEESKEIVIATGEVKRLAYTLQPKFGIVDIASEPESGASVYINDTLVGITPYCSQKLPEGEYTVRITKPLFKGQLEKLILADGKTIKRIFTLENNSCTVTVNSPLSSILVDGIKVGENSVTAILESGSHLIKAERSEQYIPVEQEITLSANETQLLELEPQPRLGGISVMVETENATDAAVYVNDTLAGKAPTVFPLIIGTHSITVKKDSYKDETEYFTIIENENSTAKFHMITLDEHRQNTIGKWNNSKWISAGVGIAAIGASIYFNQAAANSYSSYSSATTTESAANFRNKTNRQSTYYSVSMGFVITATVSAVYSWFQEQRQ